MGIQGWRYEKYRRAIGEDQVGITGEQAILLAGYCQAIKEKAQYSPILIGVETRVGITEFPLGRLCYGLATICNVHC